MIDRLIQNIESAKGVFEKHLMHPQLPEVLHIIPCIGLQEDVA